MNFETLLEAELSPFIISLYLCATISKPENGQVNATSCQVLCENLNLNINRIKSEAKLPVVLILANPVGLQLKLIIQISLKPLYIEIYPQFAFLCLNNPVKYYSNCTKELCFRTCFYSHSSLLTTKVHSGSSIVCIAGTNFTRPFGIFLWTKPQEKRRNSSSLVDFVIVPSHNKSLTILSAV